MVVIEQEQTAHYVQGKGKRLFAWMHTAAQKPLAPRWAVILCPPIGYEYMSVHRTYRHLAKAFVQSHCVVFRFDYAFTGNSSGRQSQDLTLDSCVGDLEDINNHIQSIFPGIKTCFVGFNFGAAVIAKASTLMSMDAVVLWEPPVSGRKFNRELRVLAGILNDEDSSTAAVDEAAGVFLTEEFCKQLGDYNLAILLLSRIKECLVLSGTANGKIQEIVEQLQTEGRSCQLACYRGHEGMLAYPTETEIPIEAITQQVDWLSSLIDNNELKQYPMPCLEKSVQLESNEERAISFGDKKLFGIYTPSAVQNEGSVCLVFINCGSEHHVGPHRIYTDFCRKLAQKGISSFRFDLEGIGDSPSLGGNVDNIAYSPCAMRDLDSSLAFLETQMEKPKFILTGICAGAYHSFKACAEVQNRNIIAAVLVNPLVYSWSEEEHVANAQHVKNSREFHRYRAEFDRSKVLGIILNPGMWWVVLRVVFTALIGLVSRYVPLSGNTSAKKVKIKLKKIYEAKRAVKVIIARSDPGISLLREQAGRLFSKGLKSGYLSLETIEKADHGMSKAVMREQLFKKMSEFVETFR